MAIGVRPAVARDAGWRVTACYVADALREHLPSSEILAPEQLAGEPGDAGGQVLHVEPDGSFTVVAIVWQPLGLTRIHDHVTWYALAVLSGVEYEDLYAIPRTASPSSRSAATRS